MKQDENAFSLISKDLNDIKTNHLAHIEPDMAAAKANIQWLTVLILLVIGGIVGLYFRH